MLKPGKSCVQVVCSFEVAAKMTLQKVCFAEEFEVHYFSAQMELYSISVHFFKYKYCGWLKKKTDTYSRSYIPFYFSKKKHEVVDLQSVSACQSTSYLVGGNHVEGRKKPIIPLCSLNRVILKTVSQCPLAAWCVRWEAVNVSVIGQAVYFGKSPL